VGSRNLPHAHISGGVSNVSFSFRVMTQFERQCTLFFLHEKRTHLPTTLLVTVDMNP
jgi:cobalamin-dependent methionine synthase I